MQPLKRRGLNTSLIVHCVVINELELDLPDGIVQKLDSHVSQYIYGKVQRKILRWCSHVCVELSGKTHTYVSYWIPLGIDGKLNFHNKMDLNQNLRDHLTQSWETLIALIKKGKNNGIRNID
jgi:hypothetical protein